MDNMLLKNYMTLLVHAFTNTTSSMLQMDFEQSEDTELDEKHKIKVIVSVIGKYRGRIILTTGETTSKALAFRFMGEEVTDDVEVLSCVSEILNIFSGKFVTDINNILKKQELRLTPPAVFEGEDIDIVTPNPNLKSEVLNFKSEYGKVQLDLGFEG